MWKCLLDRVARYAPKKPTQITSCRAAMSPQGMLVCKVSRRNTWRNGQPQHDRERADKEDGDDGRQPAVDERG